MKILVVEDDLNKMKQVTEFLSAEFPQHDVNKQKSFRSGLSTILSEKPDIIILDMSMPTFDMRVAETGGRLRPFAGRDILREMKRKKITSKVIVFTQFDSFSDGAQHMTLNELNDELINTYGEMYVGAVYYHPAQSDWKMRLKDYLTNISGSI